MMKMKRRKALRMARKRDQRTAKEAYRLAKDVTPPCPQVLVIVSRNVMRIVVTSSTFSQIDRVRVVAVP